MAAVARTPIVVGAREALEGSPTSTSSDTRSPRCEAFVMTGDKILNLTPNVSPSYAKLKGEQLPPHTAVHETPKRALTTSDFPSIRRSRLANSHSQPEGALQQGKRQLFAKNSFSESQNGKTTTLAEELAQAASTSNVENQSKRRSNGMGEEKSPEDERLPPPMDCSMHSSYYSAALSNPQISSQQRNGSTDTFVISSSSPVKQSTVTVNAIAPSPMQNGRSVSATSSPAIKRVLSPSMCGRSLDSSREDQKESAIRLATRLFTLNKFTRTEVAQQLDLENDFACIVSDQYMQLFQFSGIRLDAALREFLSRVELIGETAQREKLLRHFSTRYHTCNPALFKSMDEVHALTCALLLLNSDLHGPNCGKKMVVRDFVNNLVHTGGEYDRSLLKALFNSIKQNPIVADSEPTPCQSGTLPSGSAPSSARLAEVDPESQVEYKAGWIMRKSIYDSDGSRTPVGRRGWRMCYARLRGLVLYLDRDENSNKRSKWETFSNAVLLHHSIAEPATDYKKKQHCFRLRTANLGEFLFQTSNSAEVSLWVDSINFVCASFSSRALPPATGSMTSFSRPRLPNLPSTASLPMQLRFHENAANELCAQLTAVQRDAPPLKAKGRPVEEFFFKERFLTKEIERYEIYVQVLRDRLGPMAILKMGGASSDSTSGVHSKSDIGEDMDKISYREAVHQM